MIYIALIFFVVFNLWVRIVHETQEPKYVKNRLLKALFIIPPKHVTYKGLVTYLVHFVMLIIVALFYITGWIYIGDMHLIVFVIYIFIGILTCWWSCVFNCTYAKIGEKN